MYCIIQIPFWLAYSTNKLNHVDEQANCVKERFCSLPGGTFPFLPIRTRQTNLHSTLSSTPLDNMINVETILLGPLSARYFRYTYTFFLLFLYTNKESEWFSLCLLENVGCGDGEKKIFSHLCVKGLQYTVVDIFHGWIKKMRSICEVMEE